MRIIGLGLMAILMTGTAITLSGYDLLQAGKSAIHDATQDMRLVFEPDASTLQLETGPEVLFRRAGASAPLILSGLPAYGSASFGMPLSARPQSGYLQIDTTLQVLDGVEGLLRVSIDGTRRGEVLLVSGLVSRSLRIPLTAEELSRNSLNVSFSPAGPRPGRQLRQPGPPGRHRRDRGHQRPGPDPGQAAGHHRRPDHRLGRGTARRLDARPGRGHPGRTAGAGRQVAAAGRRGFLPGARRTGQHRPGRAGGRAGQDLRPQDPGPAVSRPAGRVFRQCRHPNLQGKRDLAHPLSAG